MPDARPNERPRAFYGWYITGAGAMNNFVLSAITFWGFGVFVHPLREEFGWSSALVAAGFSIRSFQQGFLAPFVGVLMGATYLVVGVAAGVEIAAGLPGVLVILALAALIALAFGSIGAFLALRTGSGEAVPHAGRASWLPLDAGGLSSASEPDPQDVRLERASK